MSNIMTPEHKLWGEFVNRLTGPEGCNIFQDKYGIVKWYCNGDTRLAASILKTMEEIDVDKSLAYFEEHGGYCDCEILLNVDKATDFSRTILGE